MRTIVDVYEQIRAIRPATDIKDDYIRTFNTAVGERVLLDLAKHVGFADVFRPVPGADSTEHTAYLNGQRDVLIYILSQSQDYAKKGADREAKQQELDDRLGSDDDNFDDLRPDTGRNAE